MPQTPREVFRRAVRFQHPDRLPRDVWVPQWAKLHHPAEVAELGRMYPNDRCNAPDVYRPSPRARGDRSKPGAYTDKWGCVFVAMEAGLAGEVREPILRDLGDVKRYRPPYETLPENPASARDEVNRFCAGTDLFVRASCCPRPWERAQFLRGTTEAMMDLMAPEDGFRDLLRVVHEFFLKELEFWIATDIDYIQFNDDWGTQQQLLIPPALWRELFKPLYRDYCRLIHSAGKFAFMHSDGQIAAILEDLVEIGVDALNSQLFCMDMADLARRAKGKITFWGEIDRQHVLPAADPQAGRDAVRRVADHFYDPAGGLVVQLEFGPGGNAATVMAALDEWERFQKEKTLA